MLYCSAAVTNLFWARQVCIPTPTRKAILVGLARGQAAAAHGAISIPPDGKSSFSGTAGLPNYSPKQVVRFCFGSAAGLRLARLGPGLTEWECPCVAKAKTKVMLSPRRGAISRV